jgi:hypothetical protein
MTVRERIGRWSICFATAVLALGAWASAAAVPAAIELISPRGGESWAAGSYHVVRWKTTARLPLRVEYTTDGGASWSQVEAAAPVDGRLVWRLPDKPSTRCRVRLSDPRTGESVQMSADVSIVPSEELRGYAWAQVTDKAPYAVRDGAGALTFKDRMWLLGGWHPSNKQAFPLVCNNEVWSSRDGATWDLVKPNTFVDKSFDRTSDWEGRHTAGYVVFRDKMWIVGGDTNQGHHQSDVWNSPDGKAWNWVNKGRDVPWAPRVLQYTVAFQDKIWIMGGQTMPSFAPAPEVFYRDIWNTSDGVNWEKVIPKEPYWSHRGMIGGSVVFKDRMWVLGGGTYDTPATPTRVFLNDVWSSADGVHWTEHEAAPWNPRQYHSVIVFEDRMWVLGGWHHGDRSDVWYSADGENWYRLNRTPWQPRHAASVFAHDQALLVAAGSAMRPDVWRLRRDPAAKSDELPWAAIKPVPLRVAMDGLEARRAHLYDTESPDRSPYPLDLVVSEAIPTWIFARTFGLSVLDHNGKNTYAQMSVDEAGNVRFQKWVEESKGLKIVVDNESRPAVVTFKWSPE